MHEYIWNVPHQIHNIPFIKLLTALLLTTIDNLSTNNG